jgi:protein-S-isoprenylcysteine O-methyltransferase Ste14
MLNPFAAFLGLICAVVAILAMIRALSLKSIAQAAQQGVKAIIAFFALGLFIRMLLPEIFTQGFLGAVGSSLFLGVGIVVLALALILISKLFSSTGNRGGK